MTDTRTDTITETITETREKFKILIVDDERSNIDALSYILKPLYTVLVAKDGMAALRVARDHHPDLILLDIVMPGLGGLEVLTELKRDESTQHIPVIFITGRDSAEDERTGLSLGAVDYITKPFHNVIVEARVRTHLQLAEYIRTIERLCMIDALTNIPNRRYFDNQIEIEWTRAIRDKTSISLLMIDVDNFKRYNDTYGHQQGDALLKSVATLLRQALQRPSDFVYRWGGDEFAVLLPDTSLDGALLVAERIRAAIDGAALTFASGQFAHVTVSLGVSIAHPAADSSPAEFLAEADKGLYSAKSAGRNKICALG